MANSAPRPGDFLKQKRFSDDKHKKHIEISLGMACNNRCIYCMNSGPRKFVPFELVLEEALSFAARGYNSIGLIGGDPTIYPRIAELGGRLRESGYRHIHIISNGRRYKDMKIVDELVAAGFNRFSVSVHSHVPEVEDELTAVPGGFEEKIAGLRNLMARFNEGAFEDRVAINIVMNRQNLGELDDTVRYFATMGIVDMRLLIIRPEGRALENFEKLVPRMTAVREKIPSIIGIVRKRRIRVMMDPPPFCLFYDIPGFFQLLAEDYVDEVVADAHAQTRASFSWNKYRVRNKDKAPFCDECCFNAKCEGVWRGYIQEFGFDEFHSVSVEDLRRVK